MLPYTYINHTCQSTHVHTICICEYIKKKIRYLGIIQILQYTFIYDTYQSTHTPTSLIGIIHILPNTFTHDTYHSTHTSTTLICSFTKMRYAISVESQLRLDLCWHTYTHGCSVLQLFLLQHKNGSTCCQCIYACVCTLLPSRPPPQHIYTHIRGVVY